MKRAIVPISLAVVSVAVTGWLFWLVFESQRNDVAVARSFLTHIAEGEYPEARVLMTPALATQAQTTMLRTEIGQIEPWQRIRFGSRSSNSSGGTRQTRLIGRGIAPSGCESAVTMTVIDGLIDAFYITPLCRTDGVDA